MARRAQPAAVKQAKGNPGRRKIGDSPKAAPEVRATFACPHRFRGRKYELHRALWKTIVPALSGMNLLRATDLPALERYIGFLAKWRTAEKLLEQSKLIQVTSSEHVKDLERVSKALMVAVMLDKRLSEIEDRFGMNPAARQGLLLKMVAAQSQPSLPLGGGQPGRPAAPDAQKAPATPIGLLNHPEGNA